MSIHRCVKCGYVITDGGLKCPQCDTSFSNSERLTYPQERSVMVFCYSCGTPFEGEPGSLCQSCSSKTQVIPGQSPQKMPPLGWFVFKDGSQAGEAVRLNGVEVTIGRSDGACHVKIANNTISGEHAKLLKSEERVLIADTNSKNGTYVNGVRIQPGQGFVTLPDNAELRLGEITLRFKQF